MRGENGLVIVLQLLFVIVAHDFYSDASLVHVKNLYVIVSKIDMIPMKRVTPLLHIIMMDYCNRESVMFMCSITPSYHLNIIMVERLHCFFPSLIFSFMCSATPVDIFLAGRLPPTFTSYCHKYYHRQKT